MRSYVILRDLSRPRTREPFLPGRDREAARPLEAPSEPHLATEELSNDDVRALSRDPEVQAIAQVMPTRLIEPVQMEAPQAKAAWGIPAVKADVSSSTGAGVVPALLDTGIDATHPAFAGVNLVEQDFSGSGNGDRQGHGSHCAGTIFGRDVDGTRIGVARGVEKALIGKVLGNDGSGDSVMLFNGMQWAVEQGAQVISMSLGFDFPGLADSLVKQGWPTDLATSVALEAYRSNLRMFDSLMEMIRSREAFGTGTLVVAAAGNESKRNVKPDYEVGVSLPAAAEGVVSVGALQQGDGGLTVAYFSNTFPQVSAPGVNILSVQAGGGLRELSGTSMATPHVSGVTALWWEAVGNLQIPKTTSSVLAKLLATSRTDVLATGVDIADRGVGIVTAP